MRTMSRYSLESLATSFVSVASRNITDSGGKKMEVVVVEGYRGSKVLNCLEEPFPIPEDDEVLIKVYASGVNKLDIWRTRFDYDVLPPDWSLVPGLECTGIIIEVGKKVHEWKVGEKICALLNGGGYAQAVVVRATQVFPIPLGKSLMYRFACLPEAACTAWEAISRLGKLSANMTLLVYERCGKICDLAVQLAEMVQARVIVARDESKYVERFSSHVTIDAKSPRFHLEVMEATGRRGVDIILDCDISAVENVSSLNPGGGTIMIVELGPKRIAHVNLSGLYSYNAVLHVVNRMWWTPEYMAEVVLDMKKKMWPAFSDGSLVLPIEGKMYSLSQAADAQSGDLIIPT